jgi:predicted secreted protein
VVIKGVDRRSEWKSSLASGGSIAAVERLKRYGLAALMAFLALNVWTGSPLLALWIGSRIQGENSQPSMGAVVAVVICLVVFSVVLYQALKRVSYAYQEATGTLPTVRTHAPWLRSMRAERPDYPGNTSRITGAERIVVATVILAAVLFEVWFFFLSGSSIGGGSGR